MFLLITFINNKCICINIAYQIQAEICRRKLPLYLLDFINAKVVHCSCVFNYNDPLNLTEKKDIYKNISFMNVEKFVKTAVFIYINNNVGKINVKGYTHL